MSGLLLSAELLMLLLILRVQQYIKLVALLSPVILYLSIVICWCAAICNALTNASKNCNSSIKLPIRQCGQLFHEAKHHARVTQHFSKTYTVDLIPVLHGVRMNAAMVQA